MACPKSLIGFSSFWLFSTSLTLFVTSRKSACKPQRHLTIVAYFLLSAKISMPPLFHRLLTKRRCCWLGWMLSSFCILALTLSMVSKLSTPHVSVYFGSLLWMPVTSSSCPLNTLNFFMIFMACFSSGSSTPPLFESMVTKRRCRFFLPHRITRHWQ